MVVARDRFGQHGLYYRLDGSGLRLSTSVAELFPDGSSPELHRAAALAYLLNGHPPQDASFFRGIAKLPPAGFLVVTPEAVRGGTYWSLERQPFLSLSSDEDYARRWRSVFLETVAEHLPEPEAGVALSAGLDSNAVAVALRAGRSEARLTALRWESPEVPEADEGPISRRAASQLGLRDLSVRADHCWPFREPIEPMLVPETPLLSPFAGVWEETFRRCRAAGLRVLFTGDGGDQLLGGNVPSYPDQLAAGRWRAVAAELRQQARVTGEPVRGLARHMLLTPLLQYLGREGGGTPPPWVRRGEGEEVEPERRPPLDRRLPPGRGLRLRLLQDPFLRAGQEAMGHQAARYGIELRHPWVDHRLVELAASLPTEQAFRAGFRKGLLRRALGDLLPPQVLALSGKIYPAALAHRGWREREGARVLALMTDMRLSDLGLVEEKALRERYEDYRQGRVSSGGFWHTLTLEAWCRRFL